MPENCVECVLMYDYLWCMAADRKFGPEEDVCDRSGRMAWCPLVETEVEGEK